MLESLFATALASLIAAAATSHAHQYLADLSRLQTAADALTAARNLVEASLGAPCAEPSVVAPCPASLRCKRVVTHLGAGGDVAGTVLVGIEVEVADGGNERRSLALLRAIAHAPSRCATSG